MNSNHPSHNLSFIDTHCHLTSDQYQADEATSLIERAEANNVKRFVSIGAGYGVDGNQKAYDLAQKKANVWATVGIHPHDAEKFNENEHLGLFENWVSSPKVVAVGEIGLDFYYEHSPKERQIEVFELFLDFAKKHKKPVVIHDRGAGFQTYEIIKKFGLGPEVVIHCFTGTQELAKKYLDLGCFLSFTGIVTFKNAKDLHQTVSFVPLEQMMIETDSPYLAPHPHRGKRNEPGFVPLVAAKIAELKNLELALVAQKTTENAEKFFQLNA